MALLVALNWENTLISTAIAVLGDCPFKGAMEPLQPVFQDVVEANQKWQVQVAVLQALHQFHQIQGTTTVTAGLHDHMAATINAEIGITPAL